MPFALIFFGIIALVVAVRDTGRDARALLVSEFTGPNNFLTWIAGIGGVGAVGYIPGLQGLSRIFLVLIFIGLFLSHDGFFAKLQLQVLNRRGRNVDVNTPGNVDVGAAPSAPTAPAAPVFNPGGQAGSPVAGTAFPAGVGSSAPWTAGLAPASGAQAACPPGTVSQPVPGWNGTAFRCVPS